MKYYIVSLDGFLASSNYDANLSFKNVIVKKSPSMDYIITLESTLDRNASLEDHINNIIANDDIAVIKQIHPQIKELYLNIGVFYDTATCTVILPNKSIVRLLSSFPQIDVRTVCYPCEEEDKVSTPDQQ